MSHGPYRLVSAASRTTARSASTARCQVSYVMAALLTRTSSLPYRPATCRAAASMLAGSVTSSWSGSALMARAAAAAAAAERAVSRTVWPRPAS